jgi:hypothetical protein
MHILMIVTSLLKSFASYFEPKPEGIFEEVLYKRVRNLRKSLLGRSLTKLVKWRSTWSKSTQSERVSGALKLLTIKTCGGLV